MTFSPPSLILFLLPFIPAAATANNGIIGFGLSIYQDLCGQSCHDSLSALYLNCTTFAAGDDTSMGMDMDMGMSMIGTTSPECYASNIPWLQTMAFCIQQNCPADGYSAGKQAESFSAQAVAGASAPTFQDSVPATAPMVELADDAVWLNGTSLVNGEMYAATHGTLKEFAQSEYIHTRYSVILYLTTISIFIISGILSHTLSASPKFQKTLSSSPLWTTLQQHIFLPALFNSRRLEPLPGRIGYLPSRILTIFIGTYIAMNVILSSISFRNVWPNTFFVSTRFEMCEYVGNRTGTLSLVNLSLAILFAGRNNVLIAVTGWSQTAFLTFHRWAARVAALQAVVHSVVYTMSYLEPGSGGYVAEAAKPFYWWGIIATIAMCLATAHAILPLRIKFYDLFLITHIALVILTLVGCWYHLVPHFGYIYGYQVWLYIAFAFWSADRFARLVRVAYYNRFGNATAIVEAIPDCDIMQVTVFPRVAWNFGPGQHTFLYFPALGKFWESHPFSIVGWKRPGQSLPSSNSASASLSDSTSKEEKVKGFGVTSSVPDSDSQPNSPARTTPPHQTQLQNYPSIQFLTRVHSGMTSTLHHRLLSSPSPSNIKISVHNEGPYAGHRATLHPLFTADTILCLAGGIGITNILGFVQEYTSGNPHRGETPGSSHGMMKKATRFILAWSAREMALIEHVRRNFLPVPKADVEGAEGVEYSFWCTDPSYTSTTTAAPKLDSLEHESRNPANSSSTPGTINPGRMDISTVLRSSLEAGRQHHTTVMVCGPGGMADEVTREVVACVRDGFSIDVVEETFAW